MLSEKQNTDRSLELLKASSYFYDCGKRLLALQFTLTVVGALAVAVIVAVFPESKIWAVLYSIVVALVDSLLLDRLQSRLKAQGAKAQEAFDGTLFELEWRQWQAGQRLAEEEVLSASAKFQGRIDYLRDWYPNALDGLPTSIQAIIFQRINVWWDAELRRKVGGFLIALLAVVSVAVVVIGVANRQSTDKLILSIVSPIFPAAMWAMREALRQFDAANRLGAIKSLVRDAWDCALSGSERGVSEKINRIQAAIFDCRSRNPLNFNWIHFLFRPRGQETMKQMAERLAADYRQKSGSVRQVSHI